MKKQDCIFLKELLDKNAYNYPEICHFVKYDDLVTNPEQEFRKIYQFLDEPYFICLTNEGEIDYINFASQIDLSAFEKVRGVVHGIGSYGSELYKKARPCQP